MSGLQQPVVSENGERVIPGSRRPDGTFRKERRVRAGYTPQEEQATYQPAMAKVFASAPKCPGLDSSAEAELKAQAQQAAKTKAQKKNEKRNAKKHEGGAPSEASSGGGYTMSGGKPIGTEAKPADAMSAPGPAESSDPPEVKLQKEVRKLNKKIREASALVEKEGKGQALTEPEKSKVDNIPGWQSEVEKLEAELKALST